MNASLEFLLKSPETAELMRELSLEELKTVELSQRDYDIGGTHFVRVNGEDFFSFDTWCGRIQNVKRLRQRPVAAKREYPQWEYMTSAVTSDAKMNEFGDEGWELVAAVQAGSENDALLYFKRAKAAR